MAGRTYRYFKGEPVYPFGHGLSYTSFRYAPLTVEPVNGSVENGLRVRTTVTNSGARAGDDVAQLYITPPRFDGAPRIALRGFQRITLNPGETKSVEFMLNPRDLSFVTAAGERGLIPGDYGLSVGGGQPDDSPQSQQARFSIARKVTLPK
jgi:beta-glucosidase